MFTYESTLRTYSEESLIMKGFLFVPQARERSLNDTTTFELAMLAIFCTLPPLHHNLDQTGTVYRLRRLWAA